MRPSPLLILVPLALSLGGCRTAVDLVTLPVRATTAVVGAGIDAVTTSQAEADRARGRQLREEDERRGREAREQARREAAERRRAGLPPEERDPD